MRESISPANQFNDTFNYKGQLLEWAREPKKQRRVPVIATVSVGNGFVAKIDDWYVTVSSDAQSSKKLAEQHCAYLALQEVSRRPVEEPVPSSPSKSI